MFICYKIVNEFVHNIKSSEKIKICFGEMVKNKKSSVDLTLDIKEIENNLKIDVAEVKNYKKGDGTTDTKQVKTNILKEAIEVVQASKKSKLQEKADLLEEYVDDIKGEKYNNDIIDTYVNKSNVLTDTKAEYKEIMDSYTGLLDKDIVKALDKISKMVEKDYLIEQKEKLNEKEGKKKSKKSPKISEIDSIAFALMQKLGINL